MTFELDARELGGKAVVVFENLYDEEDHLIADEANIDNADQTIIYKNNEKYCSIAENQHRQSETIFIHP